MLWQKGTSVKDVIKGVVETRNIVASSHVATACPSLRARLLTFESRASRVIGILGIRHVLIDIRKIN